MRDYHGAIAAKKKYRKLTKLAVWKLLDVYDIISQTTVMSLEDIANCISLHVWTGLDYLSAETLADWIINLTKEEEN